MLLQRAFVLSVSARAALAVAALALSVAFALVSAGALSGLEARGASFEEAQAAPGHALYDEGFAGFPRAEAPAGATLVDWTEGAPKVATIAPWPLADAIAVVGPYAGEAEWLVAAASGLPVVNESIGFAPLDAVVLPAANFSTVAPERAGLARLAFTSGASAPDTDLRSTPWRGIAVFFEAGAAEIGDGLVLLILVTGAVATLLSSGLIYLEVLARGRDLATVEALAGPRVVRRLVVLRTAVLVAAGLVAGTAVAFGVLRVLSAGIPGIAGGLPLGTALLTWAVVGIGAIGAGSLAGLRATGRTLRGGSRAVAVRRFPGPVRFLVVTPRLFASVVAASAVTAAILAVVIGTTAVPDTLFGRSSDDELYIADGTGNPLRASVDRFLATNAHHVDEVRAVLPETYAPTVWNGRALMVKGTDLALWRDYAHPGLVAGVWPSELGDATVGAVRARVLHIDVGDVLVVPASYRQGVESLRIVGIHQTGGIEDDEVFTDLDTAGRLAGLGPDRVTGMRVRLVEPEADWLEVRPSGIVISELVVHPDNPVALTPAVATFRATNFDPLARSRDVDLRVNSAVEATLDVDLDAHTTRVFSVPFTVPETPRLTLQVNPTTEVQTSEGTLLIGTPTVARPGVPFPVSVHRPDASAVVGAPVLMDGMEANVTDGFGQAWLSVAAPRLVTISVQSATGSGGALVRAAPAEWDDEPHPLVERLRIGTPSARNDTHATVEVDVTVVNLGGQGFNGTVEWSVDGRVAANRTASVASGQRAPFRVSVDVPYGGANLTILDLQQRIDLAPPGSAGGSDGGGGTTVATPRTVDDVLREMREEAQTARVVGADRTEAFLSQVFERVQDASWVVVMVTVVHGGTLVWVSVVREVRERESVVRLLRDLGADVDQVRRRAYRDVVLAAAPAVVVGLVVAAVALDVAGRFGFPSAFGHTLPAGDLPLYVRTGAVLIGIALMAAAYAILGAGRRQVRAVRARPLSAWVGSP